MDTSLKINMERAGTSVHDMKVGSLWSPAGSMDGHLLEKTQLQNLIHDHQSDITLQ